MSEVRLIDANALKDAHIECPDNISFFDFGEMVERFLQTIDEQPTVDAVPVVPAHWIMYSYDEAICSHCGYDRSTEFECTSEAKERWRELPKFCENCGAKMGE